MEAIRLERSGAVLVATIDHGPMNAVDDVLHHELGELFRTLKRERDARAVVLTGAGRAFSAGGDFAWFPQLSDVERLDALRVDAKQLIWDLLDVEVPVVAALNGPAVGLGASIALLCDVLVMSERASIVDPHVKVGIVAGDGGTAIWPLAVGPMLAKRYLMTGDPVPADDALRLGLAAEVCAPEALAERAMAWATRLAEGAPLALRYTKQAVNAQVKRAMLESFDTATALELVTFLSDDHREALAALREGRPPTFGGR